MPGSVQSIERAAAIIRLLAATSGRLGVVEIGNSLGLAKSTVHGLLRTLQDVGFVEQDKASAKYQLGTELLHLGRSYVDVNELRSRAINWADSLAAHVGETVRIGTIFDGCALVVHHVFRPDDSAQSSDVGALLPLHACALGKVLLAYDVKAATQVGRGVLTPFTRQTLTTAKDLTRSLATVRHAGWAADVEEMTIGEAGVAAPIRSRGGLVAGAIGVAGPVDRICDSHGHPRPSVVSQVGSAARAISRDLGATQR